MVDKLWLLKLRYLAEIFLGNERSDSATMGRGLREREGKEIEKKKEKQKKGKIKNN